MDDHIHDCTGPDATCPCGYKFTASRFSVSVEIYDNERSCLVFADAFNTDAPDAVRGLMQDAASAMTRVDDHGGPQ